MTTTPQLVSGRELDALVQEKVFGWIRHETSPMMLHRPDAMPGSGYATVPWYSTDIAAAWKIVELLRSRDCFFQFDAWQPSGDDPYCAKFGFQYSGEVRTGRAKTAPEAICLAALGLFP